MARFGILVVFFGEKRIIALWPRHPMWVLLAKVDTLVLYRPQQEDSLDRVLESLRNATCSASVIEPWSPGEWTEFQLPGGRKARDDTETPLHQSLQPLQVYFGSHFPASSGGT